MILLDTNVMSEPLRHAPEPRVIEWIDAQAMETLFLSAITVAELRAEMEAMQRERASQIVVPGRDTRPPPDLLIR